MLSIRKKKPRFPCDREVAIATGRRERPPLQGDFNGSAALEEPVGTRWDRRQALGFVGLKPHIKWPTGVSRRPHTQTRVR